MYYKISHFLAVMKPVGKKNYALLSTMYSTRVPAQLDIQSFDKHRYRISQF